MLLSCQHARQLEFICRRPLPFPLLLHFLLSILCLLILHVVPYHSEKLFNQWRGSFLFSVCPSIGFPVSPIHPFQNVPSVLFTSSRRIFRKNLFPPLYLPNSRYHADRHNLITFPPSNILENQTFYTGSGVKVKDHSSPIRSSCVDDNFSRTLLANLDGYGLVLQVRLQTFLASAI